MSRFIIDGIHATGWTARVRDSDSSEIRELTFDDDDATPISPRAAAEESAGGLTWQACDDLGIRGLVSSGWGDGWFKILQVTKTCFALFYEWEGGYESIEVGELLALMRVAAQRFAGEPPRSKVHAAPSAGSPPVVTASRVSGVASRTTAKRSCARSIPVRFALPTNAKPDDLERHFDAVAAAIPQRIIGATTAVALWRAIRAAEMRGEPPVSGRWIDVVTTLHNKGHLVGLPADRATRAALTLLAELSPLVERVDRTTWLLGSRPPVGRVAGRVG